MLLTNVVVLYASIRVVFYSPLCAVLLSSSFRSLALLSHALSFSRVFFVFLRILYDFYTLCVYTNASDELSCFFVWIRLFLSSFCFSAFYCWIWLCFVALACFNWWFASICLKLLFVGGNFMLMFAIWSPFAFIWRWFFVCWIVRFTFFFCMILL